MDYGRPIEPFFIEIPIFWAWADKFWGIWVILSQLIRISSNIDTQGQQRKHFTLIFSDDVLYLLPLITVL